MLATFTANRIRKSSAKIVPFYSIFLRFNLFVKKDLKAMAVLDLISSLNFLLRSQHLAPNPLIPNYLNPA
jgi:hypothetical protein